MSVEEINEAEILRKVLRVLSEFNLKHVGRLRDGNGNEGGGHISPGKRTIEISRDSLVAEREYYVLHELLHGDDYVHGRESPEEEKTQMAKAIFKKLYPERDLSIF